VLASKYSLVNGYDVILLSLVIGVSLGLLYLALTLCFPKLITQAVFFLAFILILIAAILILSRPVLIFSLSKNGWNIFLAILLIFFAFALLIYAFCYKKEIELASIFMYHSNKFLKESPAVFGYIALFLVLSFGLIVLCIWQYIAFGTANDPYLTAGSLFYSSGHSVFLQILNVIELIWGLQFLRDACKI
jgi:hypothetical protein